MRLFIACHIAPEVKERLARVCSEIGFRGDLKWVDAGNMHLTLKFLGEVEPDRVQHISRALSGVARRPNPTTVRLRGLGRFGPENAFRVLWAGIVAGASELAALAREVDNALLPLSFPVEKRAFSPHVTLARVREGVRTSEIWSRVAAYTEQDFGDFEVSGFALMQSELRPRGPIYSEVSWHKTV